VNQGRDVLRVRADGQPQHRIAKLNLEHTWTGPLGLATAELNLERDRSLRPALCAGTTPELA
jgi:hypothetical protein